MIEPLALAQALIRCPSVTPDDAGALDVLQRALESMGFRARRMKFGEVDNLYARLGEEGLNFCFAGHTDVVPVGDAAAWSVDPFAAVVKDGMLWGRGAADMKAAIAAMAAAAQAHLAQRGAPKGSISFLITGDEEGPGLDGTQRVLRALAAEGEKLDHCLVGEPTSVALLGDVVKNGRRGSLNCVIEASGRQGHAAYPEQHLNPVSALLDLLAALRARTLDTGAPGFEPSRLTVTTLDVGNPAHNVVPARASAKLNIRFNTAHTGDDLKAWIETEAQRIAAATGVKIETRIAITGRAFVTPPSAFTDLVLAAVAAETKRTPALSTSGGTSDARFIKDYCPVVELGLQNATSHMTDERVQVEDIETLARCYAAVLGAYFG
ncbi:MAG: succinyl-diaminopimelate desuccinylase [Hyphomonadaceae bacterium]